MITLRDAMDEAVGRRNLLEHPFYRAWSAGSLTTEDLAEYSKQYWRQVEAFPDYLRSVAGRLPEGRVKATVEENLRDEVEDDHAGLWADFAAALGVARAELDDAPVLAETRDCVLEFSQGTASRSAAFALGMLYGYESQTPRVAKTKVEGLRGHYGIDGPGVTYFELHGELDVEHSAALASALDEIVLSEADRADAVAGAAAGAEAVWGLLDGVTRVRELCEV